MSINLATTAHAGTCQEDVRTSVRTLSRLGTEGECSDALVILGVCSELRGSKGGSLHASGYRLQAQACGIDWVLL